jgi:hypothetical protein
MKVYRRSRGVAHLILNPRYWMRGVSVTLRPRYDMKRISVPIEEEVGWAAESVWMSWRRENFLPLPGFEPHSLVANSAPVNGVLSYAYRVRVWTRFLWLMVGISVGLLWKRRGNCGLYRGWECIGQVSNFELLEGAVVCWVTYASWILLPGTLFRTAS